MKEKNAENPLHPKSDSPSENSRIETAVENQAIVTPEDYPKFEREAQADLVKKNKKY